MPKQTWQCSVCYKTYLTKLQATQCEKEHENLTIKKNKNHKVIGCYCSVTWTLKCAKCKKEFNVEGAYGRHGIEWLITEDDCEDKIWECSECGTKAGINYNDVEYVMS